MAQPLKQSLFSPRPTTAATPVAATEQAKQTTEGYKATAVVQRSTGWHLATITLNADGTWTEELSEAGMYRAHLHRAEKQVVAFAQDAGRK